MANRFDVKTQTFFQIPPPKDDLPRYVMFIDRCFDLDSIQIITEPVFVRDLHYQFSVITGYSDEHKHVYEFKRKQDCVAAQKELARAWTRTGEYKNEQPDDNTA